MVNARERGDSHRELISRANRKGRKLKINVHPSHGGVATARCGPPPLPASRACRRCESWDAMYGCLLRDDSLLQTVCVQNQPISNCRDFIGRIIVH